MCSRVLLILCAFAFLSMANARSTINSWDIAGKTGYLFANQSSPYSCVKAPKSNLCSLDYDIFQFKGETGAELVRVMYISANLSLHTLVNSGMNYTKECLEDLRSYACNNIFARCTIDQGGHVQVKYNVKETEEACDKVRANCPSPLQEYLVQNCANINRNPMDWATCTPLPVPASKICKQNEQNHYTYPLAAARQYPEAIKLFSQTAGYLKDKVTKECLAEIIAITCQLQPGSICSKDQVLRMYAISRQQCSAVMDKCLTKMPKGIQDVYQMMCEILPDANKAPKVPLPDPNDLISNDLI